MARGALGVALTGSVARGDDGPGSDVDLWVLGDDDRRVHFVHEGVPVTFLVETVRRAFSLEHLGRVEVQQARILSDPHDAFGRLLAFHRKHAPRLRRATLSALREELAALDAASQRGAPVTRLLLAREALHRAVLLELYERHGLRTPKFRHVRRHLGARLARAWARAMGYEPAAAARTLERALRRVVGARRPSAVPAKARAGRLEEAHELARLEVRDALGLSGAAVRQLRALGREWARAQPTRRRALATVFSIPDAAALPEAQRWVAHARARVQERTRSAGRFTARRRPIDRPA